MKRLSFLLLIGGFAASLLAQSANVPLDYWGYSFLDRLYSKGLFTCVAWQERPLSRNQIAAAIEEISQKHRAQPSLLSKTDQRLFAQLQGDFADELQPGQAPITSERHIYSHQEASSRFHVDLYGRFSVISNRGGQFQPAQLLSETTLGGILRGHLGSTIGFYADAQNALTRGEKDVQEADENFDVSKGSPVTISGPNLFRDRALAYFIWEKPWLRIQAGRDEIDWGPGSHSGLALTRNMPPADMLRLASRFKRFSLSSAHIFLRSPLGAKYLAAHRIDISITSNLLFGAGETVIYGLRDIEPAYLNPLMLYHVAEHHLGDRDNNTLFFNLTARPFPGLKLYGEYFIDDMTSTKSLTRYFGNKFAFLGGAYWVDPCGIDNLDLRLEYARVEPFVYAHDDSINIYNNYDKTIGHWLGPNSDSAFLLAAYQAGRDFRIEATLERIRKGAGDASTRARPDQGESKYFLAGTVEEKHLAGIRLQNQIRRDLFVAVAYTYANTKNVLRQPGRNSRDHLARFECYLNY